MSETENNQPDSQAPAAPEAPVVTQPKGVRGFFKRFATKPFLILGAIVVVFALIIMSRGFSSKPKAVDQEMGVERLNAKPPVPGQTSDIVADGIKDRDAKAADKLLDSNQAIGAGMGYMPAVTKEYEDPLADYSHQSAAPAQIPKEEPLPDIPLPAESTEGRSEVAAPRPSTPAPEPGAAETGARASALLSYYTAFKNEQPARLGIELVTMAVSRDSKDSNTDRGETGERAASGSTADDARPLPRVLARMGSDFYATMDFDANSDYSKFTAATVVGGPFNGAKLHGSFERMRDRLEIVFSRIAWKGGTYTIDAIAFNPEHPQVGLADKVNYHYFERFGGLFLAAGLRAVGQEISEEGDTVVIDVTDGVAQSSKPRRTDRQLAMIAAGEVGGEVASVLRRGVDRPPTVTVPANMPIGVRLRSDWVEATNTSNVDASTTKQIAGPTAGNSRKEVEDLEIQVITPDGPAE